MSLVLAIDEQNPTVIPETTKAKFFIETKPLANRRSVLIHCGKQKLRVDAMVDTGCTHRNFISPALADWLRSECAVRDDTSGRV